MMMKHQKTITFLENTTNQPSKFKVESGLN